MDVREAYLKVRKLPGRNVFIACVDLGDRWAFNFYPKALKSDESPIPGGRADIVYKRNGKLETIPVSGGAMVMLSRGRPIDPAIFQNL
jgi:hypothetical protein